MKKIAANYVYRNDSLSEFDEKYRPSFSLMKDYIKRDLIESITLEIEEEGLFNFEELSRGYETEFRAELLVINKNDFKGVVNLLKAIDKTHKSPECYYLIENLKQLLIPKK